MSLGITLLYPLQNYVPYDQVNIYRKIGGSKDLLDPYRLSSPRGVCVLEDGSVLVADTNRSRVAAYRIPQGAKRYQYVCEVDMASPFGIAKDRTDSSLIFVSSLTENSIKAVKLQYGKVSGESKLEITRILQAQDGLLEPRGLAVDINGRFLYVACKNGVHKICLTTDTVESTVKGPDEIHSAPWGVAIIQDKCLVSYPRDKAVVLYSQGSTSPGEMVSVPGLRLPQGLGEDGEYFLVADYQAECFFVLTLEGKSYKFNAKHTRPTAITAARGHLFVADDKNDRVMILRK